MEVHSPAKMLSVANDLHASNGDKIYTKQVSLARLRKLYLDETPADVFFSFKNAETADERIPAHKILLAMESDAFKAMFYGDLKETGDIEIVDVTVDAFKEFLQFFYFDQIKLTMENINEVIYLVKKYIVADSMNICEKFLTESLTNDNVCSIYDTAIRFDMFVLKLVCKNRIADVTNLILQTKNFSECDKLVLSHILKSDVLMCTESQVFHACMYWIKVASGQDELTKQLLDNHLGDLFYEIRFGSMKLHEFADLLPSYGNLFTTDEYQEIIQMIASSEFQPKMFKRASRQKPISLYFDSIPVQSKNFVFTLQQPAPKQPAVTAFKL